MYMYISKILERTMFTEVEEEDKSQEKQTVLEEP